MPSAVVEARKEVSVSSRKILAIGAIVALLMAAVAALAVTDKAYASFRSTSSTTNSITINWDDPNSGYSNFETTGYTVYWNDVRKKVSDLSQVPSATLAGNAKTYTINGLSVGTKYEVLITYTYQVKSSGSQYQGTVGDEFLSTSVVKPTGLKYKKWSYKENALYVKWNAQTGAQKAEIRFQNAANGKTVKTFKEENTSSSYFTGENRTWGLNKKYMYKVQMRVAGTDGKWTAWSSPVYILPQPTIKSISLKSNGKLTVGWDKIKGAKKYTVYVSTKQKSGYKKVATLKSSKSKATITKFKGKKISFKKSYYIYVQATMKAGGKTYTSKKYYAYKVKGYSLSPVYFNN